MQRSSYKEPPLPVFCLYDHGVSGDGGSNGEEFDVRTIMYCKRFYYAVLFAFVESVQSSCVERSWLVGLTAKPLHAKTPRRRRRNSIRSTNEAAPWGTLPQPVGGNAYSPRPPSLDHEGDRDRRVREVSSGGRGDRPDGRRGGRTDMRERQRSAAELLLL